MHTLKAGVGSQEAGLSPSAAGCAVHGRRRILGRPQAGGAGDNPPASRDSSRVLQRLTEGCGAGKAGLQAAAAGASVPSAAAQK